MGGSSVAGGDPVHAPDALILGDETAEIARVVVEAAPGVEKIPAAERVYAYVKAAILDRTYPGGELVTDPLQQLTLGTRPSRMSWRAGYASGTDVALTRVQMSFAGTGRPLTFNFCPREALR